jgi:MarR family 2-MHQ and catechol resistance regulon transcriptional repressor
LGVTTLLLEAGEVLRRRRDPTGGDRWRRPVSVEPSRAPVRRAVENDERLDQHAEALYEALNDLVRVYQFRDRDRICCHDVSVTQCYALDALLRRGPSTLNDLADELYLDKSTASRVVATLERKGYVAKGRDPKDARAFALTVSAAGRRLYQRIRKDLVAEERALIADFDPEVREAAARLIRRLARAAEARSGRRDTPPATSCPAAETC